MSNAQDQSYSIYRAAQERMKNKTGDERDEFIVAFWSTLKVVTTNNTDLQKQLDSALKSVRQYSFQVDVLESRVARLSGEAMPIVPKTTEKE